MTDAIWRVSREHPAGLSETYMKLFVLLKMRREICP
jgi:hypothetical protein